MKEKDNFERNSMIIFFIALAIFCVGGFYVIESMWEGIEEDLYLNALLICNSKNIQSQLGIIEKIDDYNDKSILCDQEDPDCLNHFQKKMDNEIKVLRYIQQIDCVEFAKKFGSSKKRKVKK